MSLLLYPSSSKIMNARKYNLIPETPWNKLEQVLLSEHIELIVLLS